MSHQDEGRGRETVDQEADLLVDMQVEWPANPLHALFPQPGLGLAEQGGKDRRIILSLQHTEIAGPISVLLQVQIIDLRGNPAHRKTAASGNPGAQPRMLKKVVVWGEALALFKIQRGDPGGIRGVDPVGQLQEAAPLAALCHHLHRDATCSVIGHRRPACCTPFRHRPWAPGRAV